MILVTGGSRGLGKAIADHLQCHTLSRSGGTYTCSIAEFDQPMHKYDTLINNVAIAHDGLLASMSPDDIDDMLNTNLRDTIRLTRRYIRDRFNVGGNIINISSIISKRGYAGLSVYSATKGALNSFTQSIAREMGPRGFTCNAILPGYFESDMSSTLSEAKRKQIMNRTPMGRLITTNDILPLVKLLCTPGMITGQLITVDGGFTV